MDHMGPMALDIFYRSEEYQMLRTRTANASNFHPADGKAIRKIPLIGTSSTTPKNGDTDGKLSRTAILKWQEVQSVWICVPNERQGLDIIPTVHMGAAISALERNGIETNIGNLNRDIKAINRMMNAIRSTIKNLRNWIADIMEATKETFDKMEAEKENASPTLSALLSDCLNLRKAKRSD